MKKNSLHSYKVQCRTKTDLKTTNQIPKSPLRMSSLVVVHCTVLSFNDSTLVSVVNLFKFLLNICQIRPRYGESLFSGVRV